MNILDPIVAIGILTNVIKLGDLILTPEQQKTVQRVSETITLWLDYTRPLNWLRRWVTAQNGRPFLWFTIGLVILSNTVQITSGTGPFGIIVLPALPERFHTTAKALGLLITLVVVPLLVLRFGLRAVHWLIAEGRLWRLFLRYLVGAIVGSVAVGILGAILFFWLSLLSVLSFFALGSDDLEFSDPQFSMALAFLVSLPVFETVVTILMVPGLAIVCMYVLVPLNVVFVVLRGLAWRVVQYNKGAWAALLLVGTFVLAVWDIVLKTRK